MISGLRSVSVLLVAALVCSCGRPRPPKPARASFETMGTFAAVTIPHLERGQLDTYVKSAERRMGQLNSLLSSYLPDSEVSRISAGSGEAPVRVSDDTYNILLESLKYSSLSDGAFDVTVPPLLKLWGFRGGQVTGMPSEDMLKAALARVGWKHLVLADGAAFLNTAGMKIDLGGIAKGYAVDLCFEDLQVLGATNVLVDLGGNIRCSGYSREAVPWMIGIRHPFAGMNRIVGKVDLTDGLATATSGNYEQFVEIAGERYTHIIDPRTGRPVKGMASVTVICESALRADAMSTILFVLGMEDGPKLLAEIEDCRVLLIPDRRPVELWATQGFLEMFTPTKEFEDRVFVLDPEKTAPQSE